MVIVSDQEDERIKAIEYDRMTEQAANNGLIIDKQRSVEEIFSENQGKHFISYFITLQFNIVVIRMSK